MINKSMQYFIMYLILLLQYSLSFEEKKGTKECFEGLENDLLDQVRKAINSEDKAKAEPEKIGKKVVDNVEEHSTDTKRGEMN